VVNQIPASDPFHFTSRSRRFETLLCYRHYSLIARCLTPGFLRPGAHTRRGILIAFAIILLFLSVALFSPLHRHAPGKAGACSFNNLEHQLYSTGELAAVFLVLLEIAPQEARVEWHTTLPGVAHLQHGRAPPFGS
jgi:hypothetical protein